MQGELVRQAQRGDRDAFATLAGAAITRLDATARLILRDPDLAKDAVQNTLVRAWRDLPTLRDPERFDAWIHRLIVRACMDEARGLRRSRAIASRMEVQVVGIADTSSATPDPSSALADLDQLERAFRRLKPEDRALIVLRHYLDLQLPEIAATLRLPLGTVKSRLHRSMDALRASLEADARLDPDAAEGQPA
jgi:RNA polymerase sigma-70 factor (ECF subfamily)